LLAQIEGRKVADELPGLLGKRDRILAALGAEHHHRGIGRQAVEKGIGRQIDLPLGTHRGDPADGARRHDRLERIVRQAVVSLVRFVEHSIPLFHARNPPQLFAIDLAGFVAQDVVNHDDNMVPASKRWIVSNSFSALQNCKITAWRLAMKERPISERPISVYSQEDAPARQLREQLRVGGARLCRRRPFRRLLAATSLKPPRGYPMDRPEPSRRHLYGE